MSDCVSNEYAPDYPSHPGVTLKETIAAIGMTQAELAERTGTTSKTINEIVKGKALISPETALQLEKVLRVPASFWNNLSNLYRDAEVRRNERQHLRQWLDWMRKFPLRRMVELRWLARGSEPADRLQEMLRFLGVASPEQWAKVWQTTAVNFRHSARYESDPCALSAWLRKGELDAQTRRCEPYDEGRFRAVLSGARAMTTEPPEVFQPKIETTFASAGIALVFVPELPGVRACGATRWLQPDKALIQVSLRYKSDDQLWFSFFHECGHIVLHGKRATFIEENMLNDEEREANRFAANFLIPPDQYARFVRRGSFSKHDISEFARTAGVAPGIVVGRLQHDRHLPYSHCNDLKVHLHWTNS